ncbi:MAG: hypothetical protein ACXW4C_09260 [Nitrospira sp.]
MPWNAHYAKEHERNCTSGENPCTSHGINSLWMIEQLGREAARYHI